MAELERCQRRDRTSPLRREAGRGRGPRASARGRVRWCRRAHPVGQFFRRLDPRAALAASHCCITPHPNPPPQGGRGFQRAYLFYGFRFGERIPARSLRPRLQFTAPDLPRLQVCGAAKSRAVKFPPPLRGRVRVGGDAAVQALQGTTVFSICTPRDLSGAGLIRASDGAPVSDPRVIALDGGGARASARDPRIESAGDRIF